MGRWDNFKDTSFDKSFDKFKGKHKLTEEDKKKIISELDSLNNWSKKALDDTSGEVDVDAVRALATLLYANYHEINREEYVAMTIAKIGRDTHMNGATFKCVAEMGMQMCEYRFGKKGFDGFKKGQ